MTRRTAFAALSALPEFALLCEPGVSVSPEFTGSAAPQAEAKRTELADACLLEAWLGRQHRLRGLTPGQFRELHEFVRQVVPDRDSLRAARYFVAVHDAGKNPRLGRAVGAGPDDDHDEILAALIGDERHAGARRALLPTFSRLRAGDQRVIRDACRWPLGYPKLLQGEAPTGYLTAVEFHLDAEARDLDIVKSMMDVAGASGHSADTVSITFTAEAWPRMRALNRALRETGTGTAAQRMDGFLDGEVHRLSSGDSAADFDDPRQRRALARLACHLRILDRHSFARLTADFLAQPPVVRAILVGELNRDGITRRATLPHYGPALLQRMSSVVTQEFALAYYAHLLQEAYLADRHDRTAGTVGIVVADLAPLVREERLHAAEVRFEGRAGVLHPRTIDHPPGDVFPEAELGNLLRGEVAVIVGLGGGSDCVQAAMLRLLLKRRFGMHDAVVVSVRRPENQVSDTGRRLGVATTQIHADTRPIGSWRFLEGIPLEGDDPAQTYLLNALDPETVCNDLAAVATAGKATVVLGVDTGGDSLYRIGAAPNGVDASPSQDHQVLTALNALADRDTGLTVLSVVIAPGVDSPPYAEAVLAEADAAVIGLDDEDVRAVRRQYAAWHMDGSDPRRFGKTPLAWLAALSGEMGLRALPLPVGHVLSDDNPWRCFLDVRPGMRRILVMDARRHLAATAAEDLPANPAEPVDRPAGARPHRCGIGGAELTDSARGESS